MLSCCGLPALFIDAADGLHGGSGAVKPEDALVLISKGGLTTGINRFAKIARQRGARVVAVTEAPESELGQLADAITRVKVAPESDPSGMVAASSSLANAAVLGGTCLFGGRDKVFPGKIPGAILIQTVEDGLVILNADPYIHPFITASTIFLAVLLDRLRHQQFEKLYSQKIQPA